MITKIVPIGNSRGIRIPNNILKQMNIENKIELIFDEKDEKIILRPVREPREGWENSFKQMNDNNEDRLIINDSIDLEDWEW